MNPDLKRLQAYPFERLRALFAQQSVTSQERPISLSIGEPRHTTPALIVEAVVAALPSLSNYPITAGTDALRGAIVEWLIRRYHLLAIEPTHVLPVSGSREALFAIAQTVIDRSRPDPLVVCPNPFYQIYEGAALLAGATPIFADIRASGNFSVDYSAITPQQWERVQLVFVCTPGNPTGAVMTLDNWKELFALSDRYGFVIASDECYSEIYCGDAAPLGSMEAARLLGRSDYSRLMMFTSLSKRSNVPGMRSGFVAGSRDLISQYLLYRTYHGAALSPVFQAASAVAWRDEQHVIENRALYRAKFDAVTPLIQQVLKTQLPDAAFYLWVATPIADDEFARRLHAEYNVAVLPGSYLARESHGANPGKDHVRIALVAGFDECVEAARRIAAFARTL